jgi:hypothetical protein
LICKSAGTRVPDVTLRWPMEFVRDSKISYIATRGQSLPDPMRSRGRSERSRRDHSDTMKLRVERGSVTTDRQPPPVPPDEAVLDAFQVRQIERKKNEGYPSDTARFV